MNFTLELSVAPVKCKLIVMQTHSWPMTWYDPQNSSTFILGMSPSMFAWRSLCIHELKISVLRQNFYKTDWREKKIYFISLQETLCNLLEMTVRQSNINLVREVGKYVYSNLGIKFANSCKEKISGNKTLLAKRVTFFPKKLFCEACALSLVMALVMSCILEILFQGLSAWILWT